MHKDQSVNRSLGDKTSPHHCFSERRWRTEYAVVIGKHLFDGILRLANTALIAIRQDVCSSPNP